MAAAEVAAAAAAAHMDPFVTPARPTHSRGRDGSLSSRVTLTSGSDHDVDESPAHWEAAPTANGDGDGDGDAGEGASDDEASGDDEAVLEYDLFGATIQVEVHKAAAQGADADVDAVAGDGSSKSPTATAAAAGAGAADGTRATASVKRQARAQPTATRDGVYAQDVATSTSPQGAAGSAAGPRVEYTIRRTSQSSHAPPPAGHTRGAQGTPSERETGAGRTHTGSRGAGGARGGARGVQGRGATKGKGKGKGKKGRKQRAERNDKGQWLSPMQTKRTRNRLPATETEGMRRRKFKYDLANDNEAVLDDTLPGPAAYGAPKLPSPGGGRFNQGNSKSMLEWEIFTKSQIPGPKYYPKMSWDRGGTFSNAHPMSALEWEIYRARGLPSPAAYPAPKLPKPGGGRFSTANPKSDVDWIIYRAKDIPAPNTYTPNDKLSSRFRRAPEPAFQSKVVRGNYQTHLSDAIMFIQTTINPQGPNHCRNTSAFAKQADSTKPTQPGYSFSSRSEAESRALLREQLRKERRRQRREQRQAKAAAKASSGDGGSDVHAEGAGVSSDGAGRASASRSELGGAQDDAASPRPSSPTAFGVPAGDEEGNVAGAVADAGTDFNPEHSLASALEAGDQLDPYYKYFGYMPDDNTNRPKHRPVFKSIHARSRAALRAQATLQQTVQAELQAKAKAKAIAKARTTRPSTSQSQPSMRSNKSTGGSKKRATTRRLRTSGSAPRMPSSLPSSPVGSPTSTSPLPLPSTKEARRLELLANVKQHQRGRLSDADVSVPAPGRYSMRRLKAVGKQTLSRTRNASSALFGLSTRQDRWRQRMVPDPPVV